ncbi:DUF4097 family beta strand repeat-containing protein [Longibacter sp.]|uniref:DUF4097 family beta strand repeat-containing protein n=1 Tax=Longibacter sp. TaxID=2045415 RepID=UPI003EBAA5F7
MTRIPAFIVAVLALSLCLFSEAVAQPITADQEETCEPTDASNFYYPNDGEEAACITRTYTQPAPDTLLFRQTAYDDVVVGAGDGEQMTITMDAVTRNASKSDAVADLAEVGLKHVDGVYQPTGPDGDAAGWWSARFTIQVPPQTSLAIESKNGAIVVRGVQGGHHLQSKDGDIIFDLPRAANIELLAQTDHGDLSIGFPVVVEGSVNNRIQTSVGNGGPTVRLISKNGDVKIDRIE